VLGFPIAPFGVYRVTPEIVEPTVRWRDRSGKTLPGGPDLDGAGGLLYADIAWASADGSIQDVAVELVTDDGFEGSIALLDRVADRVYCQRSQRPFIVGAPRVERVRVQGRGNVRGIRTWRVDGDRMAEFLLQRAPDALLSLPIEGSWPWYGGGLGAEAAMARVTEGAPLRLQRPDRPDGPFDALTPADEEARIGINAAELRKECEVMVSDIAVRPSDHRTTQHIPATATHRQQFVDIGTASTLLLKSMDPGFGRYLGLVGTIREDAEEGLPLAYIAVGLFVWPGLSVLPDGRLMSQAIGPAPAVVEMLQNAFVERVGAREILDNLGQHYNQLQSVLFPKRFTGIEARGLLAVAGAVPPPDPPLLEPPVIGESQWLDGGGRPSMSFRQQFLFPKPPLGSLVALGRREHGNWVSRHQMVDLPAPANPQKRAEAMLLGRTQVKPPHSTEVLGKASVYLRRGLISDAPIPVTGSPTRYRAALADLFGRFGPPGEFDVPEPQRPSPPPPAPTTDLVLDGPDGLGGPPASPGHVNVSVAVPSVAELAAGALDIASVGFTFDGSPLSPIPVPTVAPGTTYTVAKRIDLPPLSLAERRTSKLALVFTDTAGVASDATERTVSYGDRRRPAVVPTGLGLIWTSRPGPSPNVELRLQWPGAPGTKYRVYIADEKSLGVPGNSRAEIAVAGGQRDRAHTLGGRDRFRLLTDPPLEAVGTHAVMNEPLPRSLATVQFVRVVPLTGQGREAEFDSCGVVPVAVPTDRAPVPPRVHVVVDPETGTARVTIEATGLDLVELQASEPGLFTEPPDPAADPPEFRLRRASGPVNDPVYAREIARGPLAVVRVDGKVVFKAEVPDPHPLSPFVWYSYWAEVRMPPERRLAFGIVELPPAGGVAPLVPAQMADMPRPFSAVSAPANAMYVPAPPVPKIEGATMSLISEAGTIRPSLTAPSTPSASSKAVDAYRLRIWEQWGEADIGKATDVVLDGGALAWGEGTRVPDAADRPPVKLWFVTVDPLGRQSDMSVTPEA
jgi:hypothetical protein